MTAAALGDRFGRRRLFAVGLVAVRGRLARPARSRRRRLADRRPRRPGRRRGVRDAARRSRSSAPPSRPSGAAPRWASLAGPHRPRRRERAGDRRRGRRRASPGSGSSGSTCRSACSPCRSCSRKIPESRGAGRRLDLRGLALITGAAFGIVWGLVRGNDAGWDSAEVLSRSPPACALRRRLRRLGAARARADAAAALLPHPRLLRPATRRSSACSRRCSARCSSSPSSCRPALGYGPLGAGAAAAAVDGDAVLRRAGRGRARRPLRRAAVHGRRPAALQALGLGWIALIADPDVAYVELVAPLIVAGCGRVDGDARRARTRSSTRSRRGRDRQGRAGRSARCASSAACSGSRSSSRCSPGSGGYASPSDFTDGFAPAIGAAAGPRARGRGGRGGVDFERAGQATGASPMTFRRRSSALKAKSRVSCIDTPKTSMPSSYHGG